MYLEPIPWASNKQCLKLPGGHLAQVTYPVAPFRVDFCTRYFSLSSSLADSRGPISQWGISGVENPPPRPPPSGWARIHHGIFAVPGDFVGTVSLSPQSSPCALDGTGDGVPLCKQGD